MTCSHMVGGTVEYQVFGWTANAKTAVYLIPMTLVNLTSFTILVTAMCICNRGEGCLPRFNPTDPELLIYSSDPHGELLRKVMENKKVHGPGKKKACFGRGDDRTVWLWVGDHDEVVSLFLLDFTIYYRPLFCDWAQKMVKPIQENEVDHLHTQEEPKSSEHADSQQLLKVSQPRSSTSNLKHNLLATSDLSQSTKN